MKNTKKLFCAVAMCFGAVVNAHAGWQQYDVATPDNSFSGYFIQDDITKSVNYYNFTFNTGAVQTNVQSELAVNYINYAVATLRDGPTLFDVHKELSGAFMYNLDFSFNRLVQGSETYGMSAYYGEGGEPLTPTQEFFYNGTVSLVPYGQPNEIDNHIQFLTRSDVVVPSNCVPEPGSLALIGLGMVGLFGRLLKRKS